MVAISFDVTYATTGVINLAQGDFLMLGSVLGAVFASSLGWPLVPALVVTVIIVGVIGAVEEVVAVRPASRLGQGARGWLLSTLGFNLLIVSIVALTLGQNVRPFPKILSEVPTYLGGVGIVPQQVFVIVIVVAL